MPDLISLLLFGIIFLAALLQTISGFGFALLAMPLASAGDWGQGGRCGGAGGLHAHAVNLTRYWRGFDWRVLPPLAVAVAPGTPVGVWALNYLTQMLIKSALGDPRRAVQPVVAADGAAALDAVGLAGRLPGRRAGGGAFNTPGPPVIIYGNLKQWPWRPLPLDPAGALSLQQQPGDPLPRRSRNLTTATIPTYLLAVALLLASGGAAIDRRISNERFRLLVLAPIFATGVLMLV